MATLRLFITLLVVLIFVTASKTKYELEEYDSVADSSAVIVTGNARFTVLTPSLIRMEYSDSGKFEDRPTLSFVNRKVPVPKFQKSIAGGKANITTSTIKLSYDGGKFTSASLKVTPVSNGAFKGWNFGMTSATDPGNLRGTFRTLDQNDNTTLNCNVNKQPHCEWGLVSRSGWALVNETGVPCLDEDDWWVDNQGKMLRNVDVHDLYLFAHGHEYKQALADYMSVGGKIPVFPRHNSGIWYTRWYDINNIDVQKIVDDYEIRSIPLDIMILDMNWHKKDDWSGFSWDRNLFPYPADSMDYLHQKGLKVGANLHDATGIGKWEDKYDEVCAAMGIDPAHPPGPKGVPFTLTNKTYVYALEDIVLKTIEDDGMDFWWIDWQQGESGGHTGQDGPRLKMNPTIWTDKMRVTDSIRRCKLGIACTNKRGVVNARWGGLGNHRYQHGFSGDVKHLSWSNLAYQAYFSATASNVGWGFWSHDIEGPGNDHEMYARWVQIGSFSGIMRSHDRGMSAGGCMSWPTNPEGCPTVDAWNVPRYFFEANRDALRARASLLPYIYTHTRLAHENGIGLTYPLYYDYPELDDAYPDDMESNLGQSPSTRQYMFGNSMMIAPVTAPGTCITPSSTNTATLEQPCGLTTMDVWVPPGKWYEKDSGILRTGPLTITKGFTLFEIPTYIKAGSVIATVPLVPGLTTGNAGQQYTSLEFTIYPGANKGSTRVYEDDGETYDYINNASYAWTTAQYIRDTTTDTVTFNVFTKNANPESYTMLPTERQVTLKLVSSMPPTSVTANGQKLEYSRWGGSTKGNNWSYDGHSLTSVIRLTSVIVHDGVTIQVVAPPANESLLSGLKGGMAAAVLSKRNLDETRITPGARHVDPKGAGVVVTASRGEELSYLSTKDASKFISTLRGFRYIYSSAIAELKAMKTSSRVAYSIALLENGMI